MKKLLLKKVFAITDLLAVALFVQTINSACIWHTHQPEVPNVTLSSLKQKNDRENS